MTADEFLQKHVHDDGIELVDGHIVNLPVSGARHDEVCGAVAHLLGGFIRSNRLGRTCSNKSFVQLSAATVRGPDILFVSYQTRPADKPTPKQAIRPPLELVVEVCSHLENSREMGRKTYEYLKAGVKVVLVVVPESASIMVFRGNVFHRPQLFSTGDELTLPDVLPGFALPVWQFFE